MTEWQLALFAGAGFLSTHHLMSHHPLREKQVQVLGRDGFLALYSVVSLVFYGPLVYLWWTTSRATPIWWRLGHPFAEFAASVLIVCGIVLAVGGMGQSGRTALMRQMSGETLVVPRGMSAFTRHPLFFGIALASLGHLLVDGGAVDVAFHGTNLAVALIGGIHQDARFLATDPTYAEWTERTRLVPLPWPVPGSVLDRSTAALAVVGLATAFAARMFLH